MKINEEQFRELVDESAQLARSSEAIDEDLFRELALGSAPEPGDGAGDAAQGPAEKRAAARIGVGVQFTAVARPIIPLIEQPATPFTVVVADVSHDGVGLVCPVEIHAKFTLEMPARENSLAATVAPNSPGSPSSASSSASTAGTDLSQVPAGTFALICTRRSVRQLPDGRYHVGATFDHPLDDPRWDKQTGTPTERATAALNDMLPKHPSLLPFEIRTSD